MQTSITLLEIAGMAGLFGLSLRRHHGPPEDVRTTNETRLKRVGLILDMCKEAAFQYAQLENCRAPMPAPVRFVAGGKDIAVLDTETRARLQPLAERYGVARGELLSGPPLPAAELSAIVARAQMILRVAVHALHQRLGHYSKSRDRQVARAAREAYDEVARLRVTEEAYRLAD